MSQKNTVEDLHRAMAGFLICLGSTLPKELAEKIASRMDGLSDQMSQNGEPNVAKLTKGFSEALLQMHQSLKQ